MKQRKLLITIILLIAAAFSLTSPAKTKTTCANSISCINNLSTVVDNDLQGIFLNNSIVVPQVNLSLDPQYPTILGEEIEKENEPPSKHIYIDLSEQKLYAFEKNEIYLEALVSTGRWGRTPVGEYKIWIKIRSTKMSGGSGNDYYYLPNVPHVMYFYNDQVSKSRGYGLHGAYWHSNFGHEMSHGCVNLRQSDAKILYDWASPTTIKSTTYASDKDPGTTISICDKIQLREEASPLCLESQEVVVPKSTTGSTSAPASTSKTKTISQASPNGLITLTLKTEDVVPDKINYNLLVKEDDFEKESSGKNPTTEQLIFSETMSNELDIKIPFNTWSPDHKHFFVEQRGGDSQVFLVFKASGEEFPDNLFLDVNDYFVREEIPYELSEITGWTAPYLLIIRTKKIDSDEEGPSYWLDVSNQNFIQLSTRF